jgi:hypothetical protein
MAKLNVSERARSVLIFRAQKYRLNILQSQLKQARTIEVPREDIVVGNRSENPVDNAIQVRFSRNDGEDAKQEIAFFCVDGKYIVLLGQEKCARLVAKDVPTIYGRLISAHVLKQARVDAPTMDEPARESAPIEVPANLSPRAPARERELPRAARRSTRKNRARRANALARQNTSAPCPSTGG